MSAEPTGGRPVDDDRTGVHRDGLAPETFDADDPRLSRFDLVREGARRDGVEIVHYAPRFAVPGTRAEKRVERVVALLFMITGGSALAFVALYIFWPWKYEVGAGLDKLYTPLLGATLGLMLLGLGFGIITYARKLMPEEVAVQERHDGASPRDEQLLTGATIVNMADETGITRRPLLKGALALGLAPVGLAAVVPLGALIKDPHSKDEYLLHTGWRPGEDGTKIRITREDGSPVRPEDISVGGQITGFPGIAHGTSNKYADSPILLIHLRADDARRAAAAAADNELHRDAQWGNFVAFSKICTHAGCPASLFEQQTNRLLCPCHQSQFQITDNARPIFGPASRSLPQLPIEVDGEGYFIAKSDFREAIGPAFWERP